MPKEVRLTLHDLKKRKTLRRFFWKKLILSALTTCLNVAVLYKIVGAFFKSKLLFKLGTRTLYRSRCILAGRSRAVDGRLRVSRFVSRLLVGDGRIPRLTRASW